MTTKDPWVPLQSLEGVMQLIRDAESGVSKVRTLGDKPQLVTTFLAACAYARNTPNFLLRDERIAGVLSGGYRGEDTFLEEEDTQSTVLFYTSKKGETARVKVIRGEAMFCATIYRKEDIYAEPPKKQGVYGVVFLRGKFGGVDMWTLEKGMINPSLLKKEPNDPDNQGSRTPT